MEEKDTDTLLDTLPLQKDTEGIVSSMLKTDNPEEIKSLVYAFNMAQIKKNALRNIKLNNLLDMVEDQAIERWEKNPNQASHKDILEYMNTIQNSIEKTNKIIGGMEDKPLIQINQQVNNITNEEYSQEDKEAVKEAVSELLKQLNQNKPTKDIIDVKVKK